MSTTPGPWAPPVFCFPLSPSFLPGLRGWAPHRPKDPFATAKVEDRVESIRFCPHRESARLSEHEKLEKQLAAEARERVSLGYAA